MPDPNAPETSPTKTITETEPVRSADVTLKRPQIVAVLSAGLIISFFLPWIQILGGGPSGLDFTKIGGIYTLLWLLPIVAFFAVIGGLSGKQYQTPGQLAAAITLSILCYALYHIGPDLFKALGIGGWVSIATSVILIVISRK